MEIIYRADDGTEFENEKECREYECQTADFFAECANVHAYDDNGSPIHFNDYGFEDIEVPLQEISYIRFCTQKAIDVFQVQGVRCGLLAIEADIMRSIRVGERYYYDWDADEWVCLEDRYKELGKIADVFVDK